MGYGAELKKQYKRRRYNSVYQDLAQQAFRVYLDVVRNFPHIARGNNYRPLQRRSPRKGFNSKRQMKKK
jgi:hypothetical protein